MGCRLKPEQFFNLIFGYNDRLLDIVDYTATQNNDSVESTEVPADEVWVVTMVSVAIANRALTRGVISIVYDTTIAYLEDNLTTSAGEYWTRSDGPYILKEGDHIEAYCGGSQNGDILRLRLNGYKMKVAQ